MATSGGFGLVYKIKIVATMTTIPKVVDGTLPGRELTVAEITAHDSAGGFKEQISSGKRSLSDWEFSTLYDTANTTHQAILTAFKATALVDTSVTKAGASETIQVPTHIYKMKVSTDIEDGVKIAWSCRASGAPTIT